MNTLYPAKISFNKSDQRYLVSFYDLKEAITEGETLEEALFNASEVLTLTDNRLILRNYNYYQTN